MELPNAYGPMTFEDKGEIHKMDRTPGQFKIWTHRNGEEIHHMVDFSDGCYRAGLPLSLETLKAMRAHITEYIGQFEDEAGTP